MGIAEDIEPVWQEKFDEYNMSVQERIEQRTPEEVKQFKDNVEPATVKYSDDKYDELRIEMNELENAIDQKRNEIMDKVIDLNMNLKEADGLVQEGLMNLIPGGPPGMGGYEITEHIIPELADTLGDAVNIPGQIDMAISEYDSLFRQRDIVSKDHIAQNKLRNNYK